MRGGGEFRDILEARLADLDDHRPPLPPTAGAGTWASRRIVNPSPLFGHQGSRFPGDVAPAAACFAYSARTRQTVRAESPARRLSPTQQFALECLRGFGAASLDEHFTPADVKRAYRLLARRFHPDSHPEAGETERTYLARAFTRITLAYHQLTAVTVS